MKDASIVSIVLTLLPKGAKTKGKGIGIRHVRICAANLYVPQSQYKRIVKLVFSG